MRVIISGATRGIGRAIAQELAKKRHELFLIARSLSDLQILKEQLNDSENLIQIFSINLTNNDDLETLKREFAPFDYFDVLINNLGIFETNQIDDTVVPKLKETLDQNLFSAINLSELVLDKMKDFEKGTIINMGSIMSHMAAPFASNYSISKHALKGWNDALREELRQYGIKVCSIYPGAVNTSSWDGMEINRDAMIQPEDIAKLVATLLEMNQNTLVEEIKLSPLQF
jgi:short-subunit dehydrogenase